MSFNESFTLPPSNCNVDRCLFIDNILYYYYQNLKQNLMSSINAVYYYWRVFGNTLKNNMGTTTNFKIAVFISKSVLLMFGLGLRF